MRIISGTHKGSRITAPKNIKARPTTDFAKEALFNVLENNFDLGPELQVLDLFSGIGNISFEFSSRGVEDLISVDLSFHSVRFISETFKKLDLKNRKVIKADALQFLRSCKEDFDIIFADPPYGHKSTEKLPQIIFEKEMLKPGGWFILEHGREFDFSQAPHFLRHRKCGNVHFSIFE